MTISLTNTSSSPPPFVSKVHPRRILVVGGGASGLVTLRNLKCKDPHAEKEPFEEVLLYERRSDVGGVWNLDDQTVQIESRYPSGTSQNNWPLASSPSGSTSSPPLWPSPSYPQLRGNVLPRFLSFSMTKFPPPSNQEVFPTLSETQNYLKKFSEPLKNSIRCNVEVVGIYELTPSSQGQSGGWKVIIKDWNESGKRKVQHFDSVVLASGWTEREFYPKAKGFETSKKLGKIHHAKWYRTPEIYRNKRVIVVGNGNSANDIASHLASLKSFSDEPVYRSIKSEASPLFVSLEDERIRDVPEIKEYHHDEGKGNLDVELINGDMLRNIDFVIFGTGYHMGDFPFVKILKRNPQFEEVEEFGLIEQDRGQDNDWNPPLEDSNLYSSVTSIGEFPSRVPGLYYQTLHARNPTLAFVGLPISTTPFVSSDLTSWFIRSVYDGSVALPSDLRSRLKYEENRVRLLKQRTEKSISLSESLKKDWENERDEKQELRKRKAAAPKALPFTLHYHIVGGAEQNDEIGFSRELRDLITNSKDKKWLDDFLDPWDDERERERMGMYRLKYQSLLRRRNLEKERVETKL